MKSFAFSAPFANHIPLTAVRPVSVHADLFSRAAKNAAAPGISPHSLRETFTVWMIFSFTIPLDNGPSSRIPLFSLAV